MNLQKSLNNTAISKLATVKKIISNCNQFESNQIYNYTLKQILLSAKSLDEMSKSEISDFQSDIIKTIKFKNWY